MEELAGTGSVARGALGLNGSPSERIVRNTPTAETVANLIVRGVVRGHPGTTPADRPSPEDPAQPRMVRQRVRSSDNHTGGDSAERAGHPRASGT
jgi:hypothetical protein